MNLFVFGKTYCNITILTGVNIGIKSSNSMHHNYHYETEKQNSSLLTSSFKKDKVETTFMENEKAPIHIYDKNTYIHS